MIKAILFDFDGTLANSLPYYVKAYDRALQKFGFKLSKKQIGQNCFNIKEDVICKALGIPEKTEEFRKAYFIAIKEYNLYYNLEEIKKTNPTYIIDRISQLKKIIQTIN